MTDRQGLKVNAPSRANTSDDEEYEEWAGVHLHDISGQGAQVEEQDGQYMTLGEIQK